MGSPIKAFVKVSKAIADKTITKSVASAIKHRMDTKVKKGRKHINLKLK